MGDGVGAFGLAFGFFGLLFALVGIALGVSLVRRAVTQQRALTYGIPAEARCLDTYLTRDSEGSSTRHVILGFTTREGQAVRFEPMGAPRMMVAGDFVTVRYLPENPEKAAVVGSGGAGAMVGLVIGLVVSTIFTVAGLAFAAGGFGFGFFAMNVTAGP
ncbi:DUF3592 domain-containing protein [Streptacidiphilus sp. N1-10]|uniref:DUF3592 domain-containing protein n=1 Tax=Streptacidiphilus jeojiensis TaxID=3229225 RepID=A0ABV6XWY5_9ACTN